MSDAKIIQSACYTWAIDGHLHTPRIVDNIDDLGLKKQDTEVSGAQCEYVDQIAGSCEDDFYGCLAIPLSEGFFVVDFAS